MKNQTFLRRLGFALAGIGATCRSEHSFKTHLVATIAVIGVLLFWT